MKRKQKIATGRAGLPELENPVLSIAEIEARAQFARFGTEDRAEYIKKIDAMTDFDLSNHALKVGIRPVSERSRIRSSVLAAYDRAKADIGKNSWANVEAVKVNKTVSDNYEDFISKFAPA